MLWFAFRWTVTKLVACSNVMTYIKIPQPKSLRLGANSVYHFVIALYAIIS